MGVTDFSVPLIIGLGNEHRRDDRCGLDVVRGLQAHLGVDARIVEGGDDASDLLDLWDGAGTVYVVDAIRSGRPSGTLHRFEIGSTPPPAGLPVTSTHGLSLADAIALGRALGRMPRRLVVYGIEVQDVSTGSGLTPAVAAGVADAIWRLAEEIATTSEVAHA
ncbi:MAG TPA: hydrogenase maturation protease [Thermoplasmata archaeon]|nr:hydrogenase maturation protease [Thermoplasmata archaeon]